MDEQAYQALRRLANQAPCVFEKAVLAGCAACCLSKRHALAEREVIACTSEVARINCGTLALLFHERATFVLRLPRPGVALAHAKSMQLQCGGLQGVQKALDATEMDVHALVQQAQANGGSLLDLPWADVVKSIAAWQTRRRAPAPGHSEY